MYWARGIKKDVEYNVTKGGVGKQMKRPASVNRHFKVVDQRMKKDTREKAVQVET